ncbi:2OG-Fe(II) oxygenase family protein, partial [Acinetobacter sp. YH12227]|uniref:2OG-Fe(II) oxygenase family protein n=1 Tax=Acinetobacter sp. YH12227 TaxID=2601158 RepID=UPI0015D2F387
MAPSIKNTETYDRTKDIKEFDDAKIGIKGLVDSGITTIPRFFVHPPETLSDIKPMSNTTLPDPGVIPTIDLSGLTSDLRSTIVEKVACASREMGFFQITNHGIEPEVLERVIGAVKDFHEQPAEIKARVYRRDMSPGFAFLTNVDLFHSKAANWNDAFYLRMGPTLPELDEIPEIIRDEMLGWGQYTKKLAEVLMELLCEGLGVEKGRLKELSFTEAPIMVGNYYSYCPQPDLTMGIKCHTDPGALTILLPHQNGRLQVKHGQEWVDVKYVPGALVVNIGDILRILSNDQYKSVEHRLLASSSHEPRVSVVVFFHPSEKESLYGPLPELISPEKPALFQQFKYTDYYHRWHTKEVDGGSL